MYNVEILPIAVKDLENISEYISVTLQNPVAANKLIDEFEKAFENLGEFPYSRALYSPTFSKMINNFEYRKLFVKNYIAFYYVDENRKTVVVSRVIYARRDFSKGLK